MNYSIYSGAGNDFVMINNINGIIPFEQQKEFTIRICTERFENIDGVIFLEKPQQLGNSIRMNYYNRDGSYGAMCGNGARCISRFAIDSGIIDKKEFYLEAVDKVYKAEIKDNNLVKIYFPPPNGYELNISVEKADGLSGLLVNYMDLGSEHLVVYIKDEPNTAFGINSLDDVKVNEWGRMLRYHPHFEPRGANVNFVDVISSNKLRIRTYERGVERETLACGTGIIASALISSLIELVRPPVSVLVQSGEILTVDFNSSERNPMDNLSLEGPAKKISDGEMNLP